MATSVAAVSLIDDADFLEALIGLEQPVSVQRKQALKLAPEALLDSPTYADAMAALENGLPPRPDAQDPGPPHHERAPHAAQAPRRERTPIAEAIAVPASLPAVAGEPISFVTAVLVLVACLTAGGAAAAFMFIA